MGETFLGKGHEVLLFVFLQGFHAAMATRYFVAPVAQAPLQDTFVEFFKTFGLRNRCHRVASSQSRQVLNASLWAGI